MSLWVCESCQPSYSANNVFWKFAWNLPRSYLELFPSYSGLGLAFHSALLDKNFIHIIIHQSFTAADGTCKPKVCFWTTDTWLSHCQEWQMEKTDFLSGTKEGHVTQAWRMNESDPGDQLMQSDQRSVKQPRNVMSHNVRWIKVMDTSTQSDNGWFIY